VSKVNQIVFLVVMIFFLQFKADIAMGFCSVSATPMGFGSYDVFLDIPSYTAGTVTVNCMSEVQRARLTAGPSQTSGTFNPRQMKHSAGTDLLNYNVFTDAPGSIIFGDGTGGTTSINLRRPVGKPAPWSEFINIFGKIPPGQNVSVGSYSDTLTITIEW